MRILGIDFETTGLDPKQERITEMGAVLWDWDMSAPTCILSCLVDPERPIPPQISALTGITDEMIKDFSKPESEALLDLQYLLGRADCAMAHNAPFDKSFYLEACDRHGISPIDIPWIDSKTDVKYPEHITTRTLRHLASEHNFLNPFAHRAVFDVLTMLKIASQYDIALIIARASEPTVYARAIVSFDEKDKAKARGYYWDGAQKIWWRGFKQSDYITEKEACGFATVLMERSPGIA